MKIKIKKNLLGRNETMTKESDLSQTRKTAIRGGKGADLNNFGNE